jgi:hypothetical protein
VYGTLHSPWQEYHYGDICGEVLKLTVETWPVIYSYGEFRVLFRGIRHVMKLVNFALISVNLCHSRHQSLMMEAFSLRILTILFNINATYLHSSTRSEQTTHGLIHEDDGDPNHKSEIHRPVYTTIILRSFVYFLIFALITACYIGFVRMQWTYLLTVELNSFPFVSGQYNLK